MNEDPHFEQEVEDALAEACSDLNWEREYAIALIVREWLEESGYLPVHDLDEDGPTKGEA